MKNNLSNIKKAINYLNNNECIGIPTETVYGLAANAYSDKATLKRRFLLIDLWLYPNLIEWEQI